MAKVTREMVLEKMPEAIEQIREGKALFTDAEKALLALKAKAEANEDFEEEVKALKELNDKIVAHIHG